MVDLERKVPKRLAALLVAFSEKLTGEQLAECVRATEQVYNYDLNWPAKRVCLWLLEDEELAQSYGFERREGLEQIQQLKWKLEALVKRLTDTGTYSMFSDMNYVARSAERFMDSYKKIVTEAEAELAKLAEPAARQKENSDGE